MDLLPEPEPRLPASPGVAVQNQMRRHDSYLLSTAIMEEEATTIDFDEMPKPSPLEQQILYSNQPSTNPPELSFVTPLKLSFVTPLNAEQSPPVRTLEPRRQEAATRLQAAYRGKEGRELAAARAHVRVGEEYDAVVAPAPLNAEQSPTIRTVGQSGALKLGRSPYVRPPHVQAPHVRPPHVPTWTPHVRAPHVQVGEEYDAAVIAKLPAVELLPPPPRTPPPARAPSSSGSAASELSERRRSGSTTPAKAKVPRLRLPPKGGPTPHKGTLKLSDRSRRNACGDVAKCVSSSVGAVQHLSTRLTGLGLLGLLILLLVSTIDAMIGVFLVPAAVLPTATLVLDESGRSSSVSRSAWTFG